MNFNILGLSMNPLYALFFPVLLNSSPIAAVNDSSVFNDHKIARVVRKAVREADPDLLKPNAFNSWRDYLKIAAIDLTPELQPLVLIKFDEDISFRNQLKTIIEWENQWDVKETVHYLYYYHWDQPPPDLILELQELHFNELSRLFKIKPLEKIPYRYDPGVAESTVYPFEDLRGGIVSPQPFDFEKGALAIFYCINSEVAFLLEPLARIYGSYFQNPSTARAYYEKCLQEITKNGYVSAEQLFTQRQFDDGSSPEWFSSYALVFDLTQQFGPMKLTELLSGVSTEMTAANFRDTFEGVFGIPLSDFEARYLTESTAK
jgi:hypothetical protein